MPKINNRVSAGFDNQVSRFLVHLCEEQEGYQEKLVDLYNHYQENQHRVLGNGNGVHTRWMSDGSFKSRLKEAGLVLERRPHEKHPKQTVIWVLGVRIKESVAAVTPPTPTPPEPKNYGHTGQSLVLVTPPQPVSHVRINGTLYDKKMVATLKAIRPFTHNSTQERMTHIVTFHNAELKHQFVNELEAELLKEQLR